MKPNQDVQAISIRRFALEWMVPCLFGLMAYTSIRRHSSAPAATLGDITYTVTGLSALVFLVMLLNGRRLTFPKELATILVALAASVAVSTLRSWDPGASLLRLQLYVSIGLAAMAVYLLYRDADRVPVAAFCLAVALVHLPFLLEVMLWVHDLDGIFFPNGPRVPNFSHVRHFAYLGFLAAASSSALIALSRRLDAASFILTSCALFGIFSMGSRGALLSWMVFVVLLAIFSRHRSKIAVHAGTALVVSAVTVWWLNASGLLLTPNIFSRLAGIAAGAATFHSGRLEVWAESIRMFVANPLFGLGPEGYWVSGCCDRTVRQSHNFILQLLMEFGVVGCLILTVLVIRVTACIGGIRRLLRLALASPENHVAASLLVAYLAYCLIDGLLYHAVPLLHFGLYCGLLAAGLHQASASSERKAKMPVNAPLAHRS